MSDPSSWFPELRPADERTALEQFLDQYRHIVTSKLADLDQAQASARRVVAVAEWPPEDRHRRVPSASGCGTRRGVGRSRVGVAAAGPRLDMVTLAALRGHVATSVRAASVEDVEGPAHGSGEAAGPSQVDDPGGTVEHHPFDERLVQHGGDRAGRDHGAIGQLTYPAPEGLVAHQHAHQRLRPLAIGGRSHRPRAISIRASWRRWAGVRARWQTVAASPWPAFAAL
jgi:hypothetical protein